MKKIILFDTTLRDGAQSAGISYTVEDNFKIARALDDFGVDYIEGGWPGSNPKAELFFKEAKKGLKLNNARLVAFGSTRHKNNKPAEDPNLKAIIKSGVEYACIFGKAWELHVTHALHCSLDDNLRMIAESVAFLKQKNVKVFFDAEHFFDGFKANSEYAMQALKCALDAGALNLVMCDTNGGTMPGDVAAITRQVRKRFPEAQLGIHAHNDAECAVANSVTAVSEGVTMVQGTINGYGERCGNANLCSIIPNIQLKLGISCVSDKKLKSLTELSRYVAEISNVTPSDSQPFVGSNAFTHKAGIHVSAVQKNSSTYEHVDPVTVGNERKVIISELSGKSNVLVKAKELKMDFADDSGAVEKIISAVKNYEHKGYQYEDADASFVLVAKKSVGKYKPFFELKGFRVIVQKDDGLSKMHSEATIKVEVNGVQEHTAANGDGPINALDNALRKALEKFYPELKEMALVDFKVRIINARAGTSAVTRVLIESRDKKESWGTIGVSENIIEASWLALVDAIEYKLLKGK